MILNLVLGLVLLIAGGEGLIRGSVSVAQQLGVSKLIIGLTLVGFGTSVPELVTCLQAVFEGAPGIAVGNVVGSNIANGLLILGVAALLCPIATTPQALKRDGAMLLLGTALFTGLAFLGVFGRFAGLGMVALLLAYIFYVYAAERRSADPSAKMHREEMELASPRPYNLWAGLALAVAGLAGIVFGARFLIEGATELALGFGISETVIGLTIVAIGTSLPELVASGMAALRKQADVAFGNVVGSSIFNLLGIMGVTAAVQAVPVPPEILRVDIWVMILTALLIVVFGRTSFVFSRTEGGLFLAGYGVYIGYLAMNAGA